MEIDKRLIVLLKRSADEIKKTVIGKDDIIIKILMTACAGGHILLEDIPAWERPLWLWLSQRHCR